ncbi:MAG: PQQ-dependent sugar dehydrogenase [Nitrososphaeraceae archaeon]|jgi:glucose/arabinose dehydrogenase|nr:PQQ-dependent sugar dehydrogenase [Nitrososphaeraceae archaeon]MDW0134967.1 PQQ-dependent sugar dehydrogenase [Nitrososphaeraceae archaeon]
MFQALVSVIITLLIILLLIFTSITHFYSVGAQEEFADTEFEEEGKPKLFDTNLKISTIVEGLSTPTSMAFVGPGDILVLEKDTGMVKRIVDGKVLAKPVLDINVANSIERCLCGIAASRDRSTTYVFLYYTEIDGKDGDDKAGKQPIGNRVYRYELSGDALINPLLLMDLPANPGPRHNGGDIIIGPDNNLYVTIGDVDGSFKGPTTETKTQNYQDGVDPDGRGGILRISQDGQPTDGILGDSIPLRIYYAYGIRNSFGIDFDPVSGNLWDTENGPGNGDEINLVLPGFNSGWQQVQGLASMEDSFSESDLQNFEGKGHYSDPELVWINTAGPTAVKFLESTKLGTTYENDMFVGDVHNGRIYHFDLTPDRKDLVLPQALSSRIIEKPSSPGVSSIVFGEGFGGITDLEMGSDGNLYVVSIGLGSIFQISHIP